MKALSTWIKAGGKVVLAASLCAVAPVAGAQADYPSKPIRIVVPFSAGGSSDIQGRLIADYLGKLYNKSVVVENRPGAGGHIGGRLVADSGPDGYTLLLGSIGLQATYGVYPTLNYQPGRSEERRVGTEGVSTCRFRWSPSH